MTGLGESEYIMVPPVLEEQIWRPELRVSKMRQIKDLGVPALHATKDIQVRRILPLFAPGMVRIAKVWHWHNIASRVNQFSKFVEDVCRMG